MFHKVFDKLWPTDVLAETLHPSERALTENAVDMLASLDDAVFRAEYDADAVVIEPGRI
jgi:hypothetical protein